ncbi:DUF924-domain-containing protein [Rhizodiscina lignyota]|uniref:DUF924-domain-containing protein n=1 Tax=Rhizodiscina lignyota TaxID=1504668 RepID=A0A9P4IDP4_9PEZI|nr:DUF924-domain-containing protein [Rhizodiscina lignyota]
MALNSKLFNPSLYKTIRSVWFADVPEFSFSAPEAAAKRWWGFGTKEEKAAFDNTCHTNFREALESIGPSKYDLPTEKGYASEKQLAPALAKPFLEEIEKTQPPDSPASTALSLFILLDQMPRNIFRDNQKVIYSHYDRLSRALIYTMLSSSPPETTRWDLDPLYRYNYVYRSWFYMPLMHSENIENHEQMLALQDSQLEDCSEKGGDEARNYVTEQRKFEVLHFDLVKRFGRYPHRNGVLGRQPTKEEEDFLSSGGATFGTG